MIKKTITFDDFEGTERTETFYFNMTEAEIAEMELGVDGGFAEMIEKIIEAKNVPKLIACFKDLLLKSYGEKSADGRRFIKTEKLTTEFTQTNAYSKMFMELATDSEKASEFVNGIIPANLGASLNAQNKANHPAIRPV